MLTNQDLKFCREYVRTGNAGKAYMRAYKTLPSQVPRVRALAAQVMQRYEIRSMIRREREEQNVELMTAEEIRARWTQIAKADPRQLIELRVGCCRYCWGVDFQYQWKEREFLMACEEVERFNANAKPAQHRPLPDIAGGFGYNHTTEPNPDCPECGGEGLERVAPVDTRRLGDAAALLFNGVKQTRNGIEILMVDRLKALEALSKIEGLFTENVKLSGGLNNTTKSVEITTDDPQKAAEIYQEMIAAQK